MTEEEFFIKNYPDFCYGDKPLSPHWDLFQYGVEFGERESEEKIEELESKIKHLTEHLEPQAMSALFEQVEEEVKHEQRIKELEVQIEKMKCCANCMYEPPFDKHCNNCIQGAIKLRYRNWKLREIKEK